MLGNNPRSKHRFKRFFSLAEVEDLFGSYGLSSEVLYAYTGRFKSSSSFIVRGMKPGKSFSGW
jgi:hypothetical protein